MPKTRKQRGGVPKAPKKHTYSQRRALERKRPIGYELPRREPLINWVKPVRPGQAPNNNVRMNMAINKVVTKLTKRKKKSLRKLNLQGTLNSRRNNSTADYIKNIKRILHKINEILREPTDEYGMALEISEELKRQLNGLEESLSTRKTALTEETPLEEVIERVIELINKKRSDSERVLIAVTVDDALTKARGAAAPEANANVNALAGMLGALRPFGRA